MRLRPKNVLFGSGRDKRPPALLAVTPPRTGERTLLGVENLLQSIAVPEPFSLELAGDADGVTLMARCLDKEVVHDQLAAHYPQAPIHEVTPEEDPLRLAEEEQAWSMTLASDGPAYVPLRTFRDDDLLDPGSDPLVALLGALSALREGERVVARLLLRSLGPDWSEAHLAKAMQRPGSEPRLSADAERTRALQTDGANIAILGVGVLAAFQGYLWVRDGETWKAVLLGAAAAAGLALGGWAWRRWKRAHSRVYDPLLIQEKVSRIAFDAELQVIAVLPPDTGPQRAAELLAPVAAAYRHYDNPAGSRFKVGKVRPAAPTPDVMHPAGPGLFGKRSILGVREAACLWHPPGAGDETPLVERSGARALMPSAKGVRGGALVGDTTAGKPKPIRFPGDLLRRHHLYVARTRMGKSTLMHHLAAHKMREKAEGRDGDAIVVVDPHADLVSGLLEHVPESLIDRVRLIDLADERGAPGINLLDTRIFSDRDRTADSVVRVAKGLWEQRGPRMQSILEQTVKTLHEANEHPSTDEGGQYTILDGLKLLADKKFRDGVLRKVEDPYLLEWWAKDFGGWHPQYRADALAPIQTRLSYYASSKRARAVLGQRRSTIDLRSTILDGGILLISTAQGAVGRDVAALVGASLLNLVDSVIREQEGLPSEQRRGVLVVVDEMQSMPRRRLRVDALGAWQIRGQLHPRHPEPRQAGRHLPNHAGHPARQRGLPGRVPSGRGRRQNAGVGTGQGPSVRGRHHVAAGAPLLRARHRRQGADARLLDDGAQAGAGRPRRRRPHPRGGRRIHPVGPGHIGRRRRRAEEGGRLPKGRGRPREQQRAGGGAGRAAGHAAEEAGQQAEHHGRGGARMRHGGCEEELLRALASMPFLDRLEMVTVSGWSRGAVYEAVERLETSGFAASVPHATDLVPSTRRFHLTAAGLLRLAGAEGATLDELARILPVAAPWRRILMERLDALAVIYRLAAAVSGVAYPIRFRWYRGMSLDAAMQLPDGRTVGIVRRGATSDRSAFSKRMWRLRDSPLPGAVLVLMPDEVRLRHSRRMLAGAPVPFFLALEREAVAAAPSDPVWSPSAVNAAIDLRSALDRVEPGSQLPEEAELSRTSLPADFAVEGPGWDIPDHMLPALLKPAEKRALDLLSDWPWIVLKDLAGLLGVSAPRASQLVNPLEGFGLVPRAPSAVRRLILTDRGLALLARRDRTPSPSRRSDGASLSWSRRALSTGATSPAGEAASCSGTWSTPQPSTPP